MNGLIYFIFIMVLLFYCNLNTIDHINASSNRKRVHGTSIQL